MSKKTKERIDALEKEVMRLRAEIEGLMATVRFIDLQKQIDRMTDDVRPQHPDCVPLRHEPDTGSGEHLCRGPIVTC